MGRDLQVDDPRAVLEARRASLLPLTMPRRTIAAHGATEKRFGDGSEQPSPKPASGVYIDW